MSHVTPLDRRHHYRQLSLRNMRADYFDRVRLVAALRNETMEACWLDVAEQGLRVIEESEGIKRRRTESGAPNTKPKAQ